HSRRDRARLPARTPDGRHPGHESLVRMPDRRHRERRRRAGGRLMISAHSRQTRTVETTEAGRLIAAWRTNHRATTFLIENLPLSIWSSRVPGVPRLTVGMIAAHLHNSRCSWIKSLGARHGVKAPPLVDLRRVKRPELLK